MDREYFERLYADNPDPWGFASSPYERRKYRTTLGALPRRRFRSALEAGCSIGIMTRLLARRCDRVLALDVAERALRHARRRRRGLAGVLVERRALPAEWPHGRFDLIVLSELLYFLDPPALDAVAEATCRSLLRGGIAVLVNWTGPTGTTLDGREAPTRFMRRAGGRLRLVRRTRRPRYGLVVLRRPT